MLAPILNWNFLDTLMVIVDEILMTDILVLAMSILLEQQLFCGVTTNKECL
jgi:hypothetical protein